MNAPRTSNLPQWKIDLVREAIRIIEAEKKWLMRMVMVSATANPAEPRGLKRLGRTSSRARACAWAGESQREPTKDWY